jgi:hypothetical protein
MNRARFFLVLIVAMTLVGGAKGQDAKPAEAPASTEPVQNPVSSLVKQQLTRSAKIMVAAAEAMPADKYNFRPTPEMNTFAHLTIHSTEANFVLCSKISGMTAPDSAKLAETDPKEKLVAGLKASFDFCSTALANVDDSKLSEPVTIFGRSSSRGGALIVLSDGFSDHYGAQAMYLRLSGILPPTAQPKK